MQIASKIRLLQAKKTKVITFTEWDKKGGIS